VIVVDETINDPRIIAAIKHWYSGAVIGVRELRPGARLLDPELPGYLLKLRQPTFVTINYSDWNKPQLAHRGYCIVSLKLSGEEAFSVSQVLREILKRPEYKTKRLRMGKVICWMKQRLFHHEV
jgi:hypothetical protein